MTAQVPKLVRSILHASYSGEKSVSFAGLERNVADSGSFHASPQRSHVDEFNLRLCGQTTGGTL